MTATLEDLCLKNIANQIFEEWKMISFQQRRTFKWGFKKYKNPEEEIIDHFNLTCCFNNNVFEYLITKLKETQPIFYLYVTFEMNKKKLWSFINFHNKSCLFKELGHD